MTQQKETSAVAVVYFYSQFSKSFDPTFPLVARAFGDENLQWPQN